MNEALIETGIRAIIGIGSAICTAIPLVSALIKAIKAKKLKEQESKAECAKNDMMTYAETLISNAEQLFKQMDLLLKKNGESAGILKKESVMSKLLAYAISKNYEFDDEFWSNKIDEIVAFTRNVNTKE